MKNIFLPANILLPKTAEIEKWAVIACDQFTSDMDYWLRVEEHAKGSPSTYNLILPEAYLETEKEQEHASKINDTMRQYLKDGVFQLYRDSYLYVERTMHNGSIRSGLMGIVDLEYYDYRRGSETAIRATEKTVIDRIPPRLRVREKAPIELPHIIMLADDHENVLLGWAKAHKEQMELVYDAQLMEGGGRICGWIFGEKEIEEFNEVFAAYQASVPDKYPDLYKRPMVLAVGDGNHSLATAKAFYEKLKAENPGVDLEEHPARFALVELENIHEESQEFEAIHRVVIDADLEDMMADMKKRICVGSEEEGFPVDVYMGEERSTVYIDHSKGELAVGILQKWMDDYLAEARGKVDYIHDEVEVIRIARKENCAGFILPSIEKSQLFRGVIADGSLPRKTFSMGHSREKRYYLEARRIGRFV